MNTLVFDIETVPDVAFGRRLYDLGDLPDELVAKAMFARRRQVSGGEFLPPEQQRVVAISCALRRGDDGFTLWSVGDADAGEGDLIRRFFEGIAKFSPDLVSWNGSGFDLPVLGYRALLWGIEAGRFWETGDLDSEFRYNNYVNRYHWRHVDLMDVLSGFSARNRVSLANMALLLGLPGKLGFAGDQVWDAYQRGDLPGIRNYCETDVLNTYLIYLRFERLRGRLMAGEHEAEVALVRAHLGASDKPHLQQFLAAWKSTPG